MCPFEFRRSPSPGSHRSTTPPSARVAGVASPEFPKAGFQGVRSSQGWRVEAGGADGIRVSPTVYVGTAAVPSGPEGPGWTHAIPGGPRWSQVVPGGHERPRAAPHGDIHHSQLDSRYQAAVGGSLFCVTSMGGVRIASCLRYQVYVLYSTYNGRRACAPVHCSPDGVTAA